MGGDRITLQRSLGQDGEEHRAETYRKDDQKEVQDEIKAARFAGRGGARTPPYG